MGYLFLFQSLYFNFYLGFSFWTLVLIGILFLLIEGTFKNQKIKLVVYVLLSLLDSLLFQYFIKTGITLDTAIVIDNIKLASNEESRGVLYQYFDVVELLRVTLFPLLFIPVYFFDRIKNINIKNYLVAPIFLLLTVFTTPRVPLMNLLSGGARYFLFKPRFLNGEERPQSVRLKNKKNYLSGVNVMVVLLESFNGTYIGEKFKGLEITPNFNKLIKEHFSVSHYFSNSVQTVKAQYALFCGRTPLLRGKASYLLDGSKLDCLPKKLKQKGYRTIFLSVDDGFRV